MLTLSAIFVAISIGFGIYMTLRILQKKPYTKRYPAAHLLTVAIGAILALIPALYGNTYLWPNIGLAVIVALFGCAVGFYKFRNSKNRLTTLAIHGILALICYLLLLYNTLIATPLT